MATTKVTFTLDQSTVSKLEAASQFLALSKSEVVREAIQEFSYRMGKLTERERLEMLRNFDAWVPKIKPRKAAQVNHEIAQIRQARRTGGRRSRTEMKS